ncbi:MAG TPA: hypothetical protein VGQ40_07915 [Chthoniobacterales bacterium]|nr:hypothetical protein [Chthoniobacterales bacterium]
MSKTSVFCIATSRPQAEHIVENLQSAGFAQGEISVLLPADEGKHDIGHVKATKAPEGATTGGVAGMGIGAALGWLAGIGSLAIPGVGPFIAAGPIMAALGGAAVGGATGGLVGALVGLGIPEYEAKLYDGKVRGGNVLVSVHAEDGDQQKRAKEILEKAGAEDISSSTEATAKA